MEVSWREGSAVASMAAGAALATLYIKEGETAEVKRLAVAMGEIFEAKGIAREALAALTLFCEAAGRRRRWSSWPRGRSARWSGRGGRGGEGNA